MDNLFGLTAREEIFYNVQVIASGQWESLGMTYDEGLRHFQKFCEFLVPEDFDPSEFSEAVYTRCQEAFLGNKGLSDELLMSLSSFDDGGQENFWELLSTWQDSGIEAIENDFANIFGNPWEPPNPGEYRAMTKEILELRKDAFEKYGSVLVSNRVIDHFREKRLSEKSLEERLKLVDIRVTRRALTQGERFCFTVANITSDGGRSMGLDLNSSTDLLVQFARRAVGGNHANDFVKDLFYEAQRSLMAYRLDDFEYIQLESPFRDKAVERAEKIVAAFESKGVGGIESEVDRLLAPVEKEYDSHSCIRIVGGDGLTADSAIVFSPTTVLRRGRAEFWYINYLFGYENEDWFRDGHMTIPDASYEGLLSSWDIRVKDGSQSQVYFSTTGTIYDECD